MVTITTDRKIPKVSCLSNNKKSRTWSGEMPLGLQLYLKKIEFSINPLSAYFKKLPSTLKQFVGNLPTNCLSVFDHFVGLALKGLRNSLLDI